MCSHMCSALAYLRSANDTQAANNLEHITQSTSCTRAAKRLPLMLRIYRRRLLEFSNKKYVLFTTYFMSSFQITWYFQRTLWPRFDFEKQLYIWVPFYYRVCIYS